MPVIGRALRRGYHLARRTRRFARDEARTGPLRAAPGQQAALLAQGLHRARLHQYPQVTEPAVRRRYVDDLTDRRVRMFNGKSGELLTQKAVLAAVLDHHLGWALPRHELAPRPAGEEGEAGDGGAGGAAGGGGDAGDADLGRPTGEPGARWALLTPRDLIPPVLLADPPALLPGTAATPVVPHPHAWRVLLRLPPVDPAQGPHRPTLVQVVTHTDPDGPFVATATAVRSPLDQAGLWPLSGGPALPAGLQVRALDPASGRAQRERTLPDPPTPVTTAADDDWGLPDPQAWRARTEPLLDLLGRFPNLRAVAWWFLADHGDLALVDATNRLDVALPQLLGPLLADARLHAAYRAAGMRRRSR